MGRSERRTLLENLNNAADRISKGGAFETSIVLMVEVRELAMEIRRSLTDLQKVGASRIATVDIPKASDELDEIVNVTEAATSTILDAVEKIEGVAAALEADRGAEAAILTEAATEIYQACGFQDLTGQRVKKIIRTLKSIDERVETICLTFGIEDGVDAALESDADDDESRLLNGPAASHEAMSQRDIDELLEKSS